MINEADEVRRILISACLGGERVRYDGKALTVSSAILKDWILGGTGVFICPEVQAGMSIPRPPSEITGGDGVDVWQRRANVVEDTGADVTAGFKYGARLALDLCRQYRIKIAVLAEASPSCGSSSIYDGSFQGITKTGVGVTAALLIENGVQVFNQYQIELAHAAYQRIYQIS